jgi:hypothetical protein
LPSFLTPFLCVSCLFFLQHSYATTLARLRKRDVSLFLSTRQRHRDLVRAWRHLRHDEVVKGFNRRVASEEFVNPALRRAAFDEAKATRKQRHTKGRLKVLQQLRSLAPPMLDSKVGRRGWGGGGGVCAGERPGKPGCVRL